MKSQVIKRSVVIDGHKTSISLEDAFWSSLKAIAQAQGATVAQTVTTIDGTRKQAICRPRSVYLYSTASALDKWASRSRRSGRTCTFANCGHRAPHGSFILSASFFGQSVVISRAFLRRCPLGRACRQPQTSGRHDLRRARGIGCRPTNEAGVC
jgi:hypothetical protein